MIPTPTDEVRAIRRELAAQFGNDLHRIVEETQRQERESGRTYVSLPARTPQREDGANQAPTTTEASKLAPAA